ncbi:hypothetical protein GTZ89_22180 [Streptomyces sp. SID8382]|uniref:hypothetical protein n=1 Tax=Streptomyces malaysiensis TaxID=92644 RepID=UPI000C2B905E|nr:hypothetical protein [Streptomyces sp. M56]AUA11266.1 hypothetical protein CFP59_03377 [Streptomyces sp. M56]MYX58296.1 hypothetical protein [Streptomyces sp. SID8382]
MHIHAYSWLGEKELFDREARRRLPDRPRPPVTAEDEEHYRTLLETFRRSELPPLETSLWLLKSRTLIRATFEEPKDAAAWLGRELTEHAPGFLSHQEADTARLARLVTTATDRLTHGTDVSIGFYLGRTSFLSLALVTCTPNHWLPGLPCPLTP